MKLRAVLIGSFLSAALTVSAAVQYVNVNNATPIPPFTTWATAATTIQDAIDAAAAGDEIVVTNGLYATGGRAIYGTMTNRVAVDKPLTLRSVNGPLFTIIQGYQVPGSTNGNGAIRCVYLTNGASLSGFTVTRGATQSAGDATRQNGGGVYCESTAVSVSNCVLIANSAAHSGGGVINGTLYNCIIASNSIVSASPISGLGGGASGSTLYNCVLSGNAALRDGGGAYVARLINCTVVNNTANSGGGVANSRLTNCIVYFNSAAFLPNYDETYGSIGLANMTHCSTTPLPTYGNENVTDNPLFVNLANGDYRLQAASPCRNAGTNFFAPPGPDLAGKPRIRESFVDLGAYEFENAIPEVAPYIVIPPQDQTAPMGGTATFSFTGGGSAPMSYQWRFDGSDQFGATNATFVLENVQLAQAGNYSVVISNSAGSITSPPAALTVTLVRYVSAMSVNPAPPFTNWATAATTIQDAVDICVPGDEIIVTNGLYDTGGRVIHGTMANRVAVDKAMHIRSVNGPEFTIIEGWQVPGITNGDGAVRCVYLANGASLSGFTLTNGATRMGTFSPPAEEGGGGGVWCESTSAVVSNCLIIGNSAWSGGGSYSGTLVRCEIRNNTAFGEWGTYMGGGGAAFGNLRHCIVIGNSSIETGGGTVLGTINNSLILSNSPNGAYGGTLNNCTVVGNLGVGADGWYFLHSGDLCTLYNSIVYHNSGGNLTQMNAYYVMSNTCTFPNLGDASNITNEPAFMNPVKGDFRLQPDSLCINAGNNALTVGPTDLDGNPRIIDNIVDMGSYEFHPIQPTLNIALTGPNVVLSWPVWASDFALQQTLVFPPSSNDWSDVPSPPVIINGENTVTLPLTTEPRLFRLFTP